MFDVKSEVFGSQNFAKEVIKASTVLYPSKKCFSKCI